MKKTYKKPYILTWMDFEACVQYIGELDMAAKQEPGCKQVS